MGGSTLSGEKKFLSMKEILAYSFALFGFQAVIFYINSYQAQFYSYAMGNGRGINMFWIPFIILAAKLISAVFDPFVGKMIDKKESKHGKLKPFILYSIAPLIILTILIFLDVKLNGILLYLYIFVTTTLWSMAMTLGDVPSQALASVLTPNPNERTNLIGISGILKSIGQAAPFVFVPVVCLIIPNGAGIEGTINGTEYFVNAIVIGIIGCALFSLAFFFNKERVPYKAEKMTFKEMFGAIKANKYLLLVMVSYFLGFARQGAMAIQAQAADAILGGANKIIILGIATAIGTMISMALTPWLIKKLDERKVFIGMSIYGFLASVLAYVVGILTNFSIVPLIITLFLLGLQFGAVNIMPMVMIADSVDYYEHKTGKRTEGIAYAVLSFSIKITLALGAAICLAFIFSSKVNYSAAEGTVITETMKKGVFFSYTIIPGITSLLAAVPIFWYDLVGKKKANISAELKERRLESNESVAD